MNNIIIRTTSQKPIYQQLYEQISSQILNGDLTSDTLLPSIRTTAKELRISIITIKKTWEILERNGYIYTVAGKGSYVKKNTKATLDKKKIQVIKKDLEDSILLSKSIGISKEDLQELINDLYDN
jgi:GntR family transcriptional regulator